MAGAKGRDRASGQQADEAEAFDPVAVGASIKAARQAAGLSMGALARQSGVSQPFISQLERGQFSPSLATLYRVAAVLDVPPSALLPEANGGGGKVARSGRGARLAMSDDGHPATARLLSRGGSSLLEAFEYEVAPGREPTAWFEHSGEEMIYVLAGVLVLELAEQEPVTLRRSDSIHFDARVPHRWVVPGRRPARIVLVVARDAKR